MSKLYGYAGKLLRVDLSNEQITEEKLDEETARKYIGGTGIGAKYIYDEVPAGVGWSDEGNRLIMAPGPLGGTAIGAQAPSPWLPRALSPMELWLLKPTDSLVPISGFRAMMALSCMVEPKGGSISIFTRVRLS